MFGAARTLNRRVIPADNEDGNRLGKAGVPGSRDRHTWRSGPEETIHAIDVTPLYGQPSACRVGMEVCGRVFSVATTA